MSEAPQILLEHRLKTLELPTFLREYDKVARQCAHEGLDPVAFLARLVEPEFIDRERRLIERRIKAAKFPTIIFDNGRPLLAIGAPGGTQIAMGVLQSLNFVDFGITPQEAVLAPRFSATNDTILVTARIPRYSYRELESAGYQFIRSPYSYQIASVHAIGFDRNGEPSGGADILYGDGMALRVD